MTARRVLTVWRGGRHAPGLTVLELVVALSLAAAVAAAVAGPLGMAVRLVALHEGRLDAHQGTRRGLERILEEVRWAEAVIAEPSCAPTGLCPARVRVRIPGGNPYQKDLAYEVTFQYNPTQREVERRLGVGVTNLASRIDAMEILYFDGDGNPASDPGTVTRVRVRLVSTLGPAAPFIVESAAALRNFRAPASGPPPGP